MWRFRLGKDAADTSSRDPGRLIFRSGLADFCWAPLSEGHLRRPFWRSWKDSAVSPSYFFLCSGQAQKKQEKKARASGDVCNFHEIRVSERG